MTPSNLTKIIGEAIELAESSGITPAEILETLEEFQNELEEKLKEVAGGG